MLQGCLASTDAREARPKSLNTPNVTSMAERKTAVTLAMELLQFCTKPSPYTQPK